MSYYLGVDLGTTYTSAAVWRNGRAQVADLGTRAPVVPSVVFLKEDASILTGETANRRGATEPSRVAREFKRRIGDTTPIMLGGSPYSADGLMARMLEWVVATVSEAEGGPPDAIVISHPANWGPYKTDLLRQAVERADLDHASLITEPEAAAIHYASQERVEPASVVAVYDLGGGTFDAAVLRKTQTGFELLGDPQGIERLGGIDFDEAVFQFVASALGGALDELDPDDSTVLAAVARLRQECVEAKETLSSDTDVSIPVLLPTLQTEVRLTRAEFEQMIRPALTDTITALRRTLRSAGVEPAEVSAVLLVGGSSRVPLVAQLVGSELGRPVAVDAHPKHGIALGAALAAAELAGESVSVVDERPEPVAPAVAAMVTAVADGEQAGPALDEAPEVTTEAADDTQAADDTEAGDEVARPAAEATVLTSVRSPREPAEPAAPPPPATDDKASSAATPPPDLPTPAPTPRPGGAERDGGGGRRWGLVAAIAAGVLVLALLVVNAGKDDGGDQASGPSTATTDAGGPSPTEAAATSTPTTATTAPAETTTAPETTVAPATLRAEITGVEVRDGRYLVSYTTTGFVPDVDGEYHLHVFLNTTLPENAGEGTPLPGAWEYTDAPSPYLSEGYGPDTRGSASEICVVVALTHHGLVAPDSGNCWPLPDLTGSSPY